jgi:hypothetical protein
VYHIRFATFKPSSQQQQHSMMPLCRHVLQHLQLSSKYMMCTLMFTILHIFMMLDRIAVVSCMGGIKPG